MSSTSPFAALRRNGWRGERVETRLRRRRVDEKFGGFCLFAFDSGVRNTRSATSALRRACPSSSPRASRVRLVRVASAGSAARRRGAPGDVVEDAASRSLSGAPRGLHRAEIDAHGRFRDLRDGRQRLRQDGQIVVRALARPRASALARLDAIHRRPGPWMARHFSRVCSSRTRRPRARASRPSLLALAGAHRPGLQRAGGAAASRLAERALRSRGAARPRRARGRRRGVAAFSSSAIAGHGRRSPAGSADARELRGSALPRATTTLTKESSIATTALRGGDAFECVVLPPRALPVSRRALGRAVRAGCENIQTRRLGRRRVARRRRLFVHPRLESETRHAGAKERQPKSHGHASARSHSSRASASPHRPMGQKVSLPDDPPPTPGAGGEAPKSPTGGQLYKFEGEAYALFHPNVTPELFDDGDDESPQWILDVRVRLTVRGARSPNAPALHASRRAVSRRRAPRATRAATVASSIRESASP